MLADGVDIVVVSKRLGHSSVAITSDTYTHLLPGAGSQAAARALSLVPRGHAPSPRIREQSVSSSASQGGHEGGSDGVVAGHSPADGAALGSRTPDLRITSASL